MNIFSRFKRNTKGVAAVEFAMIMPIFGMLMIGVVETSHYVYSDVKARNAITNLVDLFDQQEQLTINDMKIMIDIIPKIMRPVFIDATKYRVVVTSIQQDKPDINTRTSQEIENYPYVFWQEKFGNAALLASKYKYVLDGSNLQNKIDKNGVKGFTFNDGDQITFVELAITYSPLITGGYAPEGATKFTHTFMGRPRKGAYAMRPGELK